MATVLCLHGFPDGPETFTPLRGLLDTQGFTSQAPYLPGHRPEDAATFLGKAERLGTLPAALDGLADLDIEGPIHLIGHDWGAVLGYALVGQGGRYLGDRVARLSRQVVSFTALAIPPLVSPVTNALRHPRALTRFDYLAAFQLPRLPEWLIARPDFLAALTRRWSPGFELPASVTDGVTRRYRDPAVRRAVLAYYRALFVRDPFTSWRLIMSPPTVPTLVIAGERDGCFGAEVFPETTRAIGAGLVKVVSGHFPQLEASAEVMSAWLTFVATR